MSESEYAGRAETQPASGLYGEARGIPCAGARPEGGRGSRRLPWGAGVSPARLCRWATEVAAAEEAARRGMPR